MAGIELGTGYVSLVVSSRGLGKSIIGGLQGVPQDFQKVGAKAGSGFQASFAKNAVGRLGGVLKAGIVGAGATAMAVLGVTIAKGFSRLSAIEQAEAKLRGLGNSAKAVESIMTNALAAVRGTAFAMDEAATTAATAVAAGIKPGKELEKYLRLVADAATIAGTDMGEMGSIFNQTTTAGKVFSDDLNALADRGLPIFTWLQEAYGVSAVELREMVKKGKVDAATFRKVIEDNIGGAALASGDTTVGAWKNMWASISRIGANVLKGVFPNIKGALVGITGLFGKLEPIATGVGVKIGAALTTASTAALRLAPAFKGALSVLTTGDFTAAVGKALGGAEEDSPLINILLTVRETALSIQPALKALAPLAQSAFGLLATYAQGAAQTWGGIFGQLGDLIVKIMPGVQSVIVAVGSGIQVILPIVQQVIGVIMNALQDNWPTIKTIFESIGSIVTEIGTLIGVVWSALGPVLLPLITNVFNTLIGIIGGAFKIIDGLIKVVTGVLTGDWQKAGDGLLLIVGGLWQAITSIFGGAIEGLKIVFGDMINFYLEKAQGLIGGLGDIFNGIGSFVVGLVTGIGAAVSGFFATITTNVVGAGVSLQTRISEVFTAIGGFFTWLYDVAIKPVVDLISTAWANLAAGVAFIWNTAFKPIFDTAAKVITVFAKLFFAGATKIIGDAWAGLSALMMWIYDHVMHPVINFFEDAIKGAQIVMGVVSDAIGAAFAWIGDRINDVYNNVIKPVINFFRLALKGAQLTMAAVGLAIRLAFALIGSKINDVYNNVILPVINFFKDALTGAQIVMRTVGQAIREAFALIGSKIDDVYTKTIKPIIDGFGAAIDGLSVIFDEAQKAIGVVWDKIAETVKKPIDFVINTVINEGLIGPKDGSGGGFNFLANKVGVDGIDPIPWPPKGWMHGGPVFGSGRQRRGRDRIPALLDHEEHVWTREEMARFPGGHSAMAAWRASVMAGRFGGALAGGGRVWPGTTRALSGSYSGHSGIDIPDGRGMPIYAAGDGSITYSGWGRGYGNAVFQSLEGGLTAVYGHTLRVLAQVGQLVKAGQKIALVDSTGNSSGNHIHFEINGAGGFGSAANRQFTLDWLKGAGGASGPTEGQGEAGFNWSPFEIFLAPFKAFIQGAIGKVSELGDNPLAKIIAGVPKMLVDGLINKGKELVGLGSVGKPGSFGDGTAKIDGAAGSTARRAASILGPMFGFSDIGTYPGHDPSQARALDFMTKSKAQGDSMAAYAKEHASNLGIMYAIWYRRIWSVARNREGWRAYTRYGATGDPSQAHTNHVHLSFFGNGGILPDDWAVVGDRGPELIKLPGARVYSNEDSRRMLNTPNGPMRIEGTLDLGNGLRGYVQGVLIEEVRSAVNARS